MRLFTVRDFIFVSLGSIPPVDDLVYNRQWAKKYRKRESFVHGGCRCLTCTVSCYTAKLCLTGSNSLGSSWLRSFLFHLTIFAPQPTFLGSFFGLCIFRHFVDAVRQHNNFFYRFFLFILFVLFSNWSPLYASVNFSSLLRVVPDPFLNVPHY